MMLDVNAINLHYGAAQALRGVSLKAETGKVTCVLGRNGVGKTSLLRAREWGVAGLQIFLDGEQRKDLAALRHIGDAAPRAIRRLQRRDVLPFPHDGAA